MDSANPAVLAIRQFWHKAFELAAVHFRALDGYRMVAWGGGVHIGLAGLAVVTVAGEAALAERIGWVLVGLLRLLLTPLVVAAMAWLWRRMETPLGRPISVYGAAAGLWWVTTWWWGVWHAQVVLGYAAVGLLGAGCWIGYRWRHPIEPPQVERPASPPPPAAPIAITALDRLDALLRDAPVAGWPLREIVAHMEGYMSERTVRNYLAQRALLIRRGHYRAGPTLLIEPSAGEPS